MGLLEAWGRDGFSEGVAEETGDTGRGDGASSGDLLMIFSNTVLGCELLIECPRWGGLKRRKFISCFPLIRQARLFLQRHLWVCLFLFRWLELGRSRF